MIILHPILLLMEFLRSEILSKIIIVLILRVNLGVILPFAVDYSYLQINL